MLLLWTCPGVGASILLVYLPRTQVYFWYFEEGASRGAPWCDDGSVPHLLGCFGLTLMAVCRGYASGTSGRDALDFSLALSSVHGRLLHGKTASSLFYFIPISFGVLFLETTQRASLFNLPDYRGLPIQKPPPPSTPSPFHEGSLAQECLPLSRSSHGRHSGRCRCGARTDRTERR